MSYNGRYVGLSLQKSGFESLTLGMEKYIVKTKLVDFNLYEIEVLTDTGVVEYPKSLRTKEQVDYIRYKYWELNKFYMYRT